MTRKTALITGITGQDGSYLAELLLEHGYRVVGMTRRTSTDVHERIRHLAERIDFFSGDLLDQSSITAIVAEVQPTEIYNLAAQSFVPASFSQPVLTGEFTALGVTRVLEAVRSVDPSIRFYQASSSEMFGKVQAVPQNEETPFYPRSPYGVAKLYGHWITVNYRESYDLFATSGILFNHESVPGDTPIIIRREADVDIIPIAELVTVLDTDVTPQSRAIPGVEIWDGERFVRVLGGSAYQHRPVVANKGLRRLEARCGSVTTTADHVVFLQTQERPAKSVAVGDTMLRGSLPDPPARTRIDLETAWLLGAFAASDETLEREASDVVTPAATSASAARRRHSPRWRRPASGGSTTYRATASVATVDIADSLELSDFLSDGEWRQRECYTATRQKRVPRAILNAGIAVWNAFLAGFNNARTHSVDARTYSAAARTDAATGGPDRNTTFETDSPVLALGLWWMAKRALGREPVLNVGAVCGERPRPSYSIELLASETAGVKAPPLRPDAGEVMRIVEEPHFSGWLYDVTTESGRFAAGVGELVIHNSPRRGKEFVTRKISDGVARIKLGIASELRLGNLDAQRDWGFAGDYVRAMWLMLQQDRPDDYVVSTGRTYYVRDFVRLAFDCVGLDYEKFVIVDPRFYRPAEVDLLIGDPAKAKRVLRWAPEVSFETLVERMVEADLARLRPLVTI